MQLVEIDSTSTLTAQLPLELIAARRPCTAFFLKRSLLRTVPRDGSAKAYSTSRASNQSTCCILHSGSGLRHTSTTISIASPPSTTLEDLLLHPIEPSCSLKLLLTSLRANARAATSDSCSQAPLHFVAKALSSWPGAVLLRPFSPAILVFGSHCKHRPCHARSCICIMFRFRSSTSSASSPSPSNSPFTSPKASAPGLTPSSSAPSALSAVDSTASSRSSTAGSSSSIISLLQAHSSASTSSLNPQVPSPATSLAILPSEPSLTLQPLSAPQLPEPIKPAAPTPATTTTTPTRERRIHETSPSRRTSHLASPRTSRAATTTNTQPAGTPNRVRTSSTIARTQHRSSTVAAMAKKAKVGSAAKSSPFTKPAGSTATPPPASLDAAASGSGGTAKEVESTLTSVPEEGTSSSSAPVTSTKAAEPTSASSDSKQNVVVCVRMRPTRATTSASEAAVWKCDLDKNQIIPTEHHPAIAKRTTSSERAGAASSMVAAPSSHDLDHDDASSTYHFQFDKLIADGQTTHDMYRTHIAPVVRAAMDGYNGTVFAYGQTGSGKTHTMSGSDAEPGVIPSAVQQVFDMIKQEPDREFLLRVSYLEIYNETLKDLLAPLPPLSTTGASLQTTDRPASPIKGGAASTTLRIIEDHKQSRVLISGLREEIVTDPDTVLDLIQRGQDERHVGATDWNERSSRSHCVFQLTVESRARNAATQGKEVRISQLNLIDLAGSERAASQAERRKEGAFINKSLLTLGTVIAKLTEPDTGDAHIPYRDSKLTRILQTSLAGNARIAVICTLSPDAEHANETLSTLKFGKRCKLVVTTAKKGTAMDDKALLQKYRKELDALRARLEANASPNPDESVAPVDPALSLESQQKLDELNEQKAAAQREVETMQKQRTDLKGQIEHLTRLILTSQSVASEAADSFPTAGPSTPVRARSAHASALARRGPRMSDLHFASGSAYNSPLAGPSTLPDTLGGAKPFELEAELAALRRQLRQQLEARQTLAKAHEAELAARDARHAELQEAIRLHEAELDDAEVAYDRLKTERDEARKIALKEQDKAREHKKKLVEEQEANRLLKLVAKARADDGDKALQAEIDSLRAQLAAKEAEASAAHSRLAAELEEARRAIESERAARDQAQLEHRQILEVSDQLRAELAAAQRSVAELEQKQASSTRSEEDNVDAEFRDLVRGTPALEQRQADLDERERRLDRLQTELDEARQALSGPGPVQAERELVSVRDELAQSEEERRGLQVELAKARAAATGREQDAQRMAALEAELVAQKARTAEALATVARPLPVPDARAGGSVPSSPIKAFATGSSRLRNELTPASNGVHRAGSVKEYRRYRAGEDNSSPASPTVAPGGRSVLLGSSATFSAAAAATGAAEREEIERLNAVIASQRAIMSDLEKSVASWKTRMKAQADLIAQLVQHSPSHPSPPSSSDGEHEDKFASLPRTTHLALSGDQPYYGSHSYNRPPTIGLGMLGSTSPAKSTGAAWTHAAPSPLPIPSGMSSADRRKPRKTIEMDLKLLKSSPRVEHSKSVFSRASPMPESPTKRRGTNASAYYI